MLWLLHYLTLNLEKTPCLKLFSIAYCRAGLLFAGHTTRLSVDVSLRAKPHSRTYNALAQG